MTANTTKPKVIALLRVSTEKQADDRAGHDRQQTVINRAILANNLDVIRTVTLIDVSRNNVLQHPEFQGILRAIETREINGVVVADHDRFSSANDFDLFCTLDVLNTAKAKLYTGSHVYDFTDARDITDHIMLAVISETTRQQMSKRMQQGKEMKRLKRQVMSSQTHEKLG